MTRHAAALDVGATTIRGGLVDDGGRVSCRRSAAADRSSGAAMLAQVVMMASELAGEGAAAIGLGLPGSIDHAAGAIVHAVNSPLSGVAVRERLARATGLPVAIDNDGTCAALGEHVHGAARGRRTSLTLTLGTGIGGGVVHDGDVFRGELGGGTELGHVAVHGGPDGCQGGCRGRGHLEAVCSGTAIVAAAAAWIAGHPAGRLAARAGGEPFDAAAILAAADAGDVEAAALLAHAADALGSGLVTLCNAFAPSIVVIGGGFGVAAGERLLGPARGILRREAMAPMHGADVVPAALGDDAGLVGAGVLALREAASGRGSD